MQNSETAGVNGLLILAPRKVVVVFPMMYAFPFAISSLLDDECELAVSKHSDRTLLLLSLRISRLKAKSGHDLLDQTRKLADRRCRRCPRLQLGQRLLLIAKLGGERAKQTN